MDQKQAYAAMKAGRVPAPIQSHYNGYAVTPGERKDFQTTSKTAYDLYLEKKIPEYQALNVIYDGKVPDWMQDRFPTTKVLPGGVDDDPSFRFWNAFGLGSLANPKENLLKKMGLMTAGGGSLNVVSKPIDIAVGEALHAADPSSDPRDFRGRLIHKGDTEKTVWENFFHSTMLGSRLDPAKYEADAKKYDHNVMAQGAGALLRLAGLDGLQEAINDDTERTGLYRGLKGALSVGGAILQFLPFVEGSGTALGRGLSTAGKGIGRGIGTVGKGIGRGVGTVGKGIGRGVGTVGKGIGRGIGTVGKGIGRGIGTVGKGIGRGIGTVGKGIGRGIGTAGKGIGRGVGTVERGMAEPAPKVLSSDKAGMRGLVTWGDGLTSGANQGVAGDSLGLPPPARAAAVDPVSLLDRDPATLSGAEKDTLFDFRQSQRQLMRRLDSAPARPVAPALDGPGPGAGAAGQGIARGAGTPGQGIARGAGAVERGAAKPATAMPKTSPVVQNKPAAPTLTPAQLAKNEARMRDLATWDDNLSSEGNYARQQELDQFAVDTDQLRKWQENPGYKEQRPSYFTHQRYESPAYFDSFDKDLMNQQADILLSDTPAGRTMRMNDRLSIIKNGRKSPVDRYMLREMSSASEVDTLERESIMRELMDYGKNIKSFRPGAKLPKPPSYGRASRLFDKARWKAQRVFGRGPAAGMPGRGPFDEWMGPRFLKGEEGTEKLGEWLAQNKGQGARFYNKYRAQVGDPHAQKWSTGARYPIVSPEQTLPALEPPPLEPIESTPLRQAKLHTQPRGLVEGPRVEPAQRLAQAPAVRTPSQPFKQVPVGGLPRKPVTAEAVEAPAQLDHAAQAAKAADEITAHLLEPDRPLAVPDKLTPAPPSPGGGRIIATPAAPGTYPFEPGESVPGQDVSGLSGRFKAQKEQPSALVSGSAPATSTRGQLAQMISHEQQQIDATHIINKASLSDAEKAGLRAGGKSEETIRHAEQARILGEFTDYKARLTKAEEAFKRGGGSNKGVLGRFFGKDAPPPEPEITAESLNEELRRAQGYVGQRSNAERVVGPMPSVEPVEPPPKAPLPDYDTQLRKGYALQEMAEIMDRPGLDDELHASAFNREGVSRKGFRRGGERPLLKPGSGEVVSSGYSPFQRQASIRGSLAAPKATLRDLKPGPASVPVIKRLGLDKSPWQVMADHLKKYGEEQNFDSWLEYHGKASTPDSYYEYLLTNRRGLLSDYGHDYAQPMDGNFRQPKLKGINDDPAELMARHQKRWGFKPKYEAWLKARGVADSPKAYHDFLQDTLKPFQARIYKALGYKM
ncbi:MAG: hypothetical protein ABW127_13660 [Candidatus Thiodiazotropha endolucinida]